ncbi:barstar family protein [Methyloversatilis discipulorum]|uniref:barstar family protein n=1 Tax=Methyloversatilis discipulorum TaxID=1119528 RepID=UPI0026F31446|nr:barstar family protein [Methyloversatilis discipulorum]
MSALPPDSMQARLGDAARSGVFSAQPTAAARAARFAEPAGLLLIGLDLKDTRDQASLLQLFAETMGFPDTFGHNLDALRDCLGDLSWLPASGGYLLHLSNCAKPVERCKDDFDALVAVLNDAADEWRGRGTPFWVLIDQPHTRARPFMASA